MSEEDKVEGEEDEEEEESTNATGQETSVATATAEVPKPAEKPASNELKIVIVMKSDRAMIGVQAPDCDPVYETMDGDLPAVLACVPKTVEVARLKWATSKRNPKADLPKPAAPVTTATTTAARKPAAAKAAPAQPKFF